MPDPEPIDPADLTDDEGEERNPDFLAGEEVPWDLDDEED